MRNAITALAVLVGLALAARAPAAEADGKALFVEYKCNSCHAVSAQGIAVVEEEATEDEEATDDEEVVEPADLSDVGTRHDQKWLKDWLMKKVELDGKKHRKKYEFKGKDLDVLTGWLAGLKDPVKE